ncbi:MAG: hypothetical protein K6F64_10185 [Clostridia bacterium]|nr:hypothetical protein [Clostridia bacterium]
MRKKISLLLSIILSISTISFCAGNIYSDITINREMLLNEDFTDNFAETLCVYLNGKIDEELDKGEGTDFDLIDEYVDVINYILGYY